METRLVKIKNEWKKIGDTVIRHEPICFLFWQLPFFINKKYVIKYIGCDSSCMIERNNKLKTIISSVNIIKL